MSDVIRKIKLTQLENELIDVRREMLRLEGVINSTKIKSQALKEESKKKLHKLIQKKNKLTDTITEAMFLGADV